MKHLSLILSGCGRRVLVISALFVTLFASAQTQVSRRPFEAEIGIIGGYGLNKFDPLTGIYVAARYNYADVPFDLGMEYTDNDFYNRKGDYYFKSQNLKVMSNYNFYKWKNFTPFVGLGAGLAWITLHDEFYKGQANYGEGQGYIVSPRIGVEAFEHARLTLEYDFYPGIGYQYFKYSHHLEIKLGIAFGGGKKNK
jgi:hypothetical protein